SSIETTTGTVHFSRAHGRKQTRKKRDTGSVFTGVFQMTMTEFEQLNVYARSIIPPRGIQIVFNGEMVPVREPLAVFEEALETELASAIGEPLRKSKRISSVEVYEPLAGETAMLYE